MRHAARRLRAWLISDVRQKMIVHVVKGLLVLPAMLLTPIGWAVLAGGSREAAPAVAYFIVSSGIGLFSVFVALFLDIRSLAGSIRWALLAGLVIGSQLAVYILASGLPRHADVAAANLWLVGGPLVVAVHCAYLLLQPRKTPNKAPEPTPGSVTPHADA